MTVHTNRGTRIIKFECDSCAEILDTETADWASAMEVQDNAGWFYRKVDGTGIHHCDGCGPIPKAAK